MKSFKKTLVQDCTNYNLLNLLDFNRYSKPRKDIEESLRKNGFTDEIKVVKTKSVTGKYELFILDGQNRFKTAMQMNIPFDYIIERETNDINEISSMVITYNSTQKPWLLRDYINLYKHFGNHNYVKLIEVMVAYNCSSTTAASLLAGYSSRNENVSKNLKHGTFEIKSYDKTIEILNEIREIKQITAVNNRFIMAFAQFYTMNKYNRAKFLKNLETHLVMIKRCREISNYIEVFKYLQKR